MAVTRTYLSLISNRSTNLGFEVWWDGIDLVCCTSVVPDLLHHLGLIVATNFPIAIHADVAARVRLHTSLLFKMACYHCPSLYLRVSFLTPAVVHFGQAQLVDQTPDADDHSPIMMTDGGATLITLPLVSQCH